MWPDEREKRQMNSISNTAQVQRAHAYQFRVPVNEHSGRRTTRTNYLVRLDVSTPYGDVSGLGECQPRAADTGDSGEGSWAFLLAVLQRLERVTIDAANKAAAVTWVRERMSEFAALARAMQAEREKSRQTIKRRVRDAGRGAAQLLGRRDPRQPYRGVLFGVETAMLDVVARLLNVPVANLLGNVAPSVPTAKRVEVQRDDANAILIPDREVLGVADHDPLWFDLRARVSLSEAHALVAEIANRVNRGELRPPILLEHPFGLRRRDQLPILQKSANSLAGLGSIRIMSGGQSAWSTSGLRHVAVKGGGSALTIKPASAGGILASLVLAKKAREIDPEIMLTVNLHEGAGAVAKRELDSLAVAMPGLAYVARRDERTAVRSPDAHGLGTDMPYEELVDSVTMHRAFPVVPEPSHVGPHPNEYPEVTYLQPLGPNGTKGHLLERQALALGLTTTRFSKGAFVATDGVHDPLLIKWSRSPLSSAVSLALCTHKEATRIRLRRAGVPVPRGRTFVNGDYDSGRAFAERIGYPVVVKPAMGVRGIGVVANIRNEKELDLAFDQFADSKLGDQDFIVEKHIPGGDYRIVVVGDEVVAAILREPASVVGDGERTVAELMIHKNLRRRLNPHLWGRPIMYDEAARYQLARENMTLESVPEAGRRVMLSNSSSLSQGGDSFDVLDELHPSIKQASLEAVKAVPGLAFCGVDFLIEDHTKPLEGQHAGVCQPNAHAAIGNCEYPLYGQPRGVASAFMDECIRRYGLIAHDQRAETLALKLTIKGRVTAVGYRAWMRRQAKTFGVRGWVQNAGKRSVEAVLVGDTEPVSALAAAAVLGPRKALPTSVATTHVVPPEVSGQFQVVRKAPKEVAHVA